MRTARWLPALALIALVVSGLPLGAQEVNRAAVIVRFDEETSISQCVSFGEEEVNGYDLLELSGVALEVQFEGLGGIVCGIEGTGCAAGDCLCACQGGGDCVYWSYWLQADDGWQYAQIGATGHAVENGAVEGWSWGPGSLTDAIEPPFMSFEEICEIPEAGQSDIPISRLDDQLSPGALVIFGGIVVFLIAILLVVRRRRPAE